MYDSGEWTCGAPLFMDRHGKGRVKRVWIFHLMMDDAFWIIFFHPDEVDDDGDDELSPTRALPSFLRRPPTPPSSFLPFLCRPAFPSPSSAVFDFLVGFFFFLFFRL